MKVPPKADSCPVGSILMWGSATAPTGWFICNGSLQLQANYQDLFDIIGHNFGNPSNEPAFDPSTEFYLPDLRGRFVRGVDDANSNRDPDRTSRTDMQDNSILKDTVGSVQLDEFKEHDHKYVHLRGRGGIASGSHWASGSDKTAKTGGKETRPLNAYLYYIIKWQAS